MTGQIRWAIYGGLRDYVLCWLRGDCVPEIIQAARIPRSAPCGPSKPGLRSWPRPSARSWNRPGIGAFNFLIGIHYSHY